MKERVFSIQAEHVRGEPTFWSLLEWDGSHWKEPADEDYDGSPDKRKVVRWARKHGRVVNDD